MGVGFVGLWGGFGVVEGGKRRVRGCGRRRVELRVSGGGWLDDDGEDVDDVDGSGGFSKSRYGGGGGQEEELGGGGGDSSMQQPWEESPTRLFIPEELMTDPVFIWEVQGMMVQYFRGLLDESHASKIEEYLNSYEKPPAEETRLKRERFRETAVQAIKNNPSAWLLRNWRTKRPIDIDSVYREPTAHRGYSAETIQHYSVIPPEIDPAVMEELDELAIQQTLLRNNQQEADAGYYFVECRSCGKEVLQREVFEYGTCANCNQRLADQRRQSVIRTLTGVTDYPDISTRSWPKTTSYDSTESTDALTRYFRDALVLKMSSQKTALTWLWGGDPAVYSAESRKIATSGFLDLCHNDDDDDGGDDDDHDGDDGGTHSTQISDGTAVRNAELPPNAAEQLLTQRVAYFGSSPDVLYRKEDVVLAAGGRGAYRAALLVLCKPGDNVLIPLPSEGMYETVATELGVHVRYYEMDMDSRKVDVKQIAKKIDKTTKALVVSNPSRISGFLHSEEDLVSLCEMCEALCVPIIADEVLSDFVYKKEWFSKMRVDIAVPERKFVPVAKVALGRLPVFTIGEISHRFPTSFTRLGWLLLSGNVDMIVDKVRDTLRTVGISQVFLNMSPMVTEFLPMLDKVAVARAEGTVRNTSRSLIYMIESLHRDAFYCMLPSAGSSVMVSVDCKKIGFHSTDSMAFDLLSTDSIGVIPGSVFHMPEYCFLQPTGAARKGNAFFKLRIALDQRQQATAAKKFGETRT